MNLVNGWKSYIVALVMVGLGIMFALGDPVSTYADPYGDVGAAFKKVVSVVLICQGVAIATLRHAISMTTAHTAHQLQLNAAIVAEWSKVISNRK